MSGHSKWHTTKRHKAVIDAKRGKIFSVLAKEITLAARAGGGNPESNARLRTLMDKARSSNMPTDNIKRAVQKGTGEIPGVTYEEIVYEGYAPGGVGLIVEVTTDNKNRAAAEVRQAFNDNGGNMAQTGAVSHSFQKRGQFLIGGNLLAHRDIAMDFNDRCCAIMHADHHRCRRTGMRDARNDGTCFGQTQTQSADLLATDQSQQAGLAEGFDHGAREARITVNLRGEFFQLIDDDRFELIEIRGHATP